MDPYLLLARQGLTNATSGNIQATAIKAQATSENAYVTSLNSKRYLTVLDYAIGSAKAPVTCLISYEDSIQICPAIKNQVFYSSRVDL